MSQRFLHLEKDRKGEAKEPREDDSPEPPLPTGLNPARFRPEPEPSLALAEEPAGAVFVRCARCGADNTRFAVTCSRCDLSLQTPEQRAFNAQFAERLATERHREEQLWSLRRAEQEALRAQEAAELREAQLALGLRLAQRERERVENELGDGFASLTLPQALRRIQNPRIRLAVLLGLGLLALLPWLLTSSHGSLGLGLRLVSLAVLVAFAPPGWWRNRRSFTRWRL
jgi:hypothetical protein